MRLNGTRHGGNAGVSLLSYIVRLAWHIRGSMNHLHARMMVRHGRSMKLVGNVRRKALSAAVLLLKMLPMDLLLKVGIRSRAMQ